MTRQQQPEEIVRVLRLLEYTGPRAAIERTLENNSVKGTTRHGDLTIREACIGQFPEIVPVNPITIWVAKSENEWWLYLDTPNGGGAFCLGEVKNELLAKVLEDWVAMYPQTQTQVDN